MQRKKIRRILLPLIPAAFILMNVVAFFHAWKFTHFADSNGSRTRKPEQLTAFAKMQTLAFGVSNPRPVNSRKPSQAFETIRLKSNKEIECWKIDTEGSKGTVVLFHGYSGEKSSMLARSDKFIEAGYSTMLVDFMGSGGSEGNQTTIGFKEAEQVKTVYDYLVAADKKNIYLFGTSMGSVAILKAVNDHNIHPKGIILECPFGSMYETTCARFRTMNVPTFPMAAILVFWGGLQNGFWAFDHNPTAYAKGVNCPTLLLYGALDIRVSKEETESIYANLNGKKQLKTYTHAGHEIFSTSYQKEWVKDVRTFLDSSL